MLRANDEQITTLVPIPITFFVTEYKDKFFDQTKFRDFLDFDWTRYLNSAIHNIYTLIALHCNFFCVGDAILKRPDPKQTFSCSVRALIWDHLHLKRLCVTGAGISIYWEYNRLPYRLLRKTMPRTLNSMSGTGLNLPKFKVYLSVYRET